MRRLRTRAETVASWTAEIATLREMREAGLPNQVIATKLHTTVGHLHYLIEIGNLPRRASNVFERLWTPEQITELDRLLCSGLSFKEAATQMGKTKNQAIGAAYRHLQRPEAPLPPPSRPLLEFPDKGKCQWIDGDVMKGTASFSCQAPVVSGEAWCPAHLRRVYPPGQQPRRL